MTVRCKVQHTDAQRMSIFIAGDERVYDLCQEYVNKVGMCVNIKPTLYVYTGGRGWIRDRVH